MADKTAQPEAMYCLGCLYRLDHLKSNKCPECGEAFNPKNAATYATTPGHTGNRIARRVSLLYLLWGTLAVIGFLAFFNRWPAPFMALFCLAVPFYLAAASYTLLIHPGICLLYAIHHAFWGKPFKAPLLHLLWSAAITAVFYALIFNGYVLHA